MNVRLKKNFNFISGIVFKDQYISNIYNVTVHIVTATNDANEQNIAYERLRYWVDHVIADSVLISDSSSMLAAHQATNRRILSLPEEPVDQLIGIMLYLKLNAITQGRLIITDVELASTTGDDVTYIHSEGENIGSLEGPGWWNDTRPCWTNVKKKGKVVNLDRAPEWADLELDWHDSDVGSNVVVFGKFDKDETK